MTLRLISLRLLFLTASEPFPTSGLLENSKGCFCEIALFPVLLFFRFALRCRLVHVEVCHESSIRHSIFKLTHYQPFHGEVRRDPRKDCRRNVPK